MNFRRKSLLRGFLTCENFQNDSNDLLFFRTWFNDRPRASHKNCPPCRRQWAKSGRRPRSEAGSVAPRAKKNKKRAARVGESFSRDRALLRSTGASQARYVSRLRCAPLKKEPLLACQDLGIEVYFMLFRNQTLRNC